MAQLALLAVGVALAGYSAYSAHETKQDQKAALQQQEEYAKTDLATKKQKIIAQQRASFTASGISLTGGGLPDVMQADTEVASQSEANRLSNYYDTQIGNVNSEARGSYINAASSVVSSAGSYYNSGVN